jgi:uncharacterized membrane protein (UPF0127 family)
MAFCLAGRVGAAEIQSSSPNELFSEQRAKVISNDGTIYPLIVEIARTPAQRAQGLMYRTTLAPGRGMLFDFTALVRVRMWMKNTLIPLDMLFLDQQGRVIAIVEQAQPGDLTPVGPDQPVLAVLELPGGQSRLWSLTPGARVVHPMFDAHP